MLYRGSRDGYTRYDFLGKCKDYSNTLVVIKSWEYDHIFGGYVSVPWTDEDGYICDENAFIFSITHNA